MSSQLFQSRFAIKFKEKFELGYWSLVRSFDRQLDNKHYKDAYTSRFGLDDRFYEGKKVLDIGCGPRGSLEWAQMTKERYGLDPLAKSYLKMGADQHQMSYVEGYVENIPFEENYFDIICSFNSLDHVSDLTRACNEIKRVLKSGGVFLLVVEIHKMPTPTEPQCLKWDFVESFFEDFIVLDKRNLNQVKMRRMYTNLKHNSSKGENPKGNGVLVTRLQKP